MQNTTTTTSTVSVEPLEQPTGESRQRRNRQATLEVEQGSQKLLVKIAFKEKSTSHTEEEESGEPPKKEKEESW